MKIDSLLKLLPSLKDDTNKVNVYNKIGILSKGLDPKKALGYAQKALKLSENLKWVKGEALACEIISIAYTNTRDFNLALNNSQRALQKWEEIGHKKGLCNSLAMIGLNYSDLGNDKKAMEYYIRSLKLAEEIKYKQNIVNNLTNIACLYSNQNQLTQALEYFSKALKFSEEFDFKNNIAMNLGNIGNVYSAQGENAKALEFYFKAKAIDKKLGNEINAAGWLLNIGAAYQLQSDSAKKKGNIQIMNAKSNMALKYFFEALQKNTESSNTYFEANILGNIGAIYITQKKYQEAEDFLSKAYSIALKTNAPDEIMVDEQRFWQLYKDDNKPALALNHFERYVAIKDSISNEGNKQAITELQIKYETEKKESENTALSQQNKILELSASNNKYLTVGLIALLILVSGFGFLILRQNKLKSKQENVRLGQKLLRTQMNPHFIFNSLASIESFIYEHQPKEAGDYLAQFARLMRLTLENSACETISLEKELETLNYYLALQKLRLNDNLEYNIDLDNAINTEQIFLPPMLTQPFIENVIEHGFRGLNERGTINISFKLKENYLEIKITDNGIGIVQAQQQKELYKNHKSMALQITHERLSFLNKVKKQKLIFSMKEIVEENKVKGTEVIFSIPV